MLGEVEHPEQALAALQALQNRRLRPLHFLGPGEQGEQLRLRGHDDPVPVADDHVSGFDAHPAADDGLLEASPGVVRITVGTLRERPGVFRTDARQLLPGSLV